MTSEISPFVEMTGESSPSVEMTSEISPFVEMTSVLNDKEPENRVKKTGQNHLKFNTPVCNPVRNVLDHGNSRI
jgi:hypothetical protein